MGQTEEKKAEHCYFASWVFIDLRTKYVDGRRHDKEMISHLFF